MYEIEQWGHNFLIVNPRYREKSGAPLRMSIYATRAEAEQKISEWISSPKLTANDLTAWIK